MIWWVFQIAIPHYGGRQNSTDEKWFKELEALPDYFKQQGLTGKCGMTEFQSFYEYELTIPNVTYENSVSIT